MERALEDAKGTCGMADYIVRLWNAWHHHMASTFLAMFVLLILTVRIGKQLKGLAVQDVKVILEKILPKRKFNKREVIQLVEERIRKREATWNSYHKNDLGT